MSVTPTTVVVTALRNLLLRALPAKCAELNAARAASVRSTSAGPWAIGAGLSIGVGLHREGTWTQVALPTGVAVSAAAVAGAINAAVAGVTATVDTDGALLIANNTPPADGAPSVLSVGPDTYGALGAASGGSAVFGWGIGGEYNLSSAIAAPSYRGVADGWPTAAPDMGQPFWVILGDRKATPVGGSSLRRDEWEVGVEVWLARPSYAESQPRSRDPITAVLQAVSEVLLSTEGRYLGLQNSAPLSVLKLEITEQSVAGQPVEFEQLPNILHDMAHITLAVRVFQRPANS